MGYQVYEDRAARDYGVERWAGYGVPAVCDVADCETEIDRGMGFRCETYWVYDSDGDDEGHEVEGCGLHFCSAHLDHEVHGDAVTPKPDVDEWVQWMLTDESWSRWRDENTDRVALIRGEKR